MSEGGDNGSAAAAGGNEDSLRWLRDHGVTVETPADRAAVKKAAASLLTLKEGDPNTRTFKYVRIPAALDEPLEEVTAVVPSDRAGACDQLPALLAPRFGSGEVDAAALKESTLQEMAGGLGEFSLSSLTPETIAAAGGQAEPFVLSDDVTMYLDAVGALKRLPVNPRAADLADRCGYGRGVAFHGDVYVGRLDRAAGVDGPRNVDFALAEASPGAPWVRTAHAENAARQAAEPRPGGVSAEELASRGGEGEGYTWTQDTEEVEVVVPAPKGVKAKSVNVKFAVSTLGVSVDGGAALQLQLFGKVVPDGCSWSMSDGNVVVTLEKATEGEAWPTLTRA